MPKLYNSLLPKHVTNIRIEHFPYDTYIKLKLLAKQRKMTRDQLVIDILKRELDRQ